MQAGAAVALLTIIPSRSKHEDGRILRSSGSKNEGGGSSIFGLRNEGAFSKKSH